MAAFVAALRLATILALLCANAAAAELASVQAATYAGEKACERCHPAQDRHFANTLHAKAFRENPRTVLERQHGEACHGPASNHVANPGDHSALIGFTKDWGTSTQLQNDRCLHCHDGGERLHWPESTHAKNLLGCSDCHNPMARLSATGLLAKPSISEVCQIC